LDIADSGPVYSIYLVISVLDIVRDLQTSECHCRF